MEQRPFKLHAPYAAAGDQPKAIRQLVEGFETGKWLETACEDEGQERIKDIPTLIMHGGDDRICDIEGSRAVYRNALSQGENVSFREWPGLFHEIYNGGPESEGDEVIDAMKSVGEMLPPALRETGEGGCAACPSVCPGTLTNWILSSPNRSMAQWFGPSGEPR